MATTKKSGKKGGASAKKGSKKSSKKGGSLSSVLSNIGTIAGTVGTVAGTIGGRKGELRVAAPSGGNINDLVTALKKKFREAGCPMCRSGIDRIVLEDIVA